MTRIGPFEANALVHAMSKGQLIVFENAIGIFLYHNATGERQRLLPYQMTDAGLLSTATDFWAYLIKTTMDFGFTRRGLPPPEVHPPQCDRSDAR